MEKRLSTTSGLMNDLKLCKDCKHYKKSWVEHLIFGNDADDKCFHPVLSENLVTGKVKGGRVCSFMKHIVTGKQIGRAHV